MGALFGEVAQLQQGGATVQQVLALVHKVNCCGSADRDGIASNFSVQYVSRTAVDCNSMKCIKSFLPTPR